MKSNFTSLVLLLSILGNLLFPISSQGQPGSLDPTFGSGGIAVTPIGGSNEAAEEIAVQSDGKLVTVGQSYNGSNYDIALARYNTDGSLDITFGTNGKLTIDVGGGYDEGQSLAIQTDGKIVVAGLCGIGSYDDFVVIRFNSNGTLDNTFGTNGKVITDIANWFSGARSVALQGDGKILAAGFSWGDTSYEFTLVRYNINGTLDGTFGSGGIVKTDFGGYDEAWSIIIQGDSKIVVAGYSNTTKPDFAIARYNSNGTLDNSFATGGKIRFAFGSGNDYCWSVVLQTDGKLVLGGDTYNGSNYDFALARLNTNGSFDNTFGSAGKVITSNSSGDDEIFALAIQSDGKILATGYSTTAYLALLRYNNDGTLDNSFGTGGVVTSANGEARGIAIQSDGKILLSGGQYNADEDFAVWRYISGVSLGCTPVSISTQPTSQTAIVGDTVSFSAGVNGSSPFSFQWYKNNISIPGATHSVYTTPLLTLADSGNSYKCKIVNCSSTDSIISNVAVLTVHSGSYPSITISSSTIPPWQRENENLIGTVKFQLNLD